MLAEYLGLAATIALALAFAYALLGVARSLRRRLDAREEGGAGGGPVDSRAFACGDDADGEPRDYPRASLSAVAILFLVFQAGALYFYLWGATLREGGLDAAAQMAWFTLPLLFGLHHAWAKGAFE